MSVRYNQNFPHRALPVHRFLLARPIFGCLSQTFPDLTTIEAHISQLPLIERSQNRQIRLMLTLGYHGSNPLIDEAAESRNNRSDCSSRCG
jgi:hypothetical protein